MEFFHGFISLRFLEVVESMIIQKTWRVRNERFMGNVIVFELYVPFDEGVLNETPN